MAEVSAALASSPPVGRYPGLADPGKLTAREREVLELILAGQSNREIAEGLVLSPETVKTHVRHILAKTGAARKADLRAKPEAGGKV